MITPKKTPAIAPPITADDQRSPRISQVTVMDAPNGTPMIRESAHQGALSNQLRTPRWSVSGTQG